MEIFSIDYIFLEIVLHLKSRERSERAPLIQRAVLNSKPFWIVFQNLFIIED